MTSPTPEPYRRSRFDPQDTLYQRCLGGAALAGALLLVAILLAPIRHTEITRVDQLSRRFARLILEPSAPRPLPSAGWDHLPRELCRRGPCEPPDRTAAVDS